MKILPLFHENDFYELLNVVRTFIKIYQRSGIYKFAIIVGNVDVEKQSKTSHQEPKVALSQKEVPKLPRGCLNMNDM